MAFRSDALRPAAERLEELAAHLGDGPAARDTLATVRTIVEACDLERTEALRRAHLDDLTGTGPNQGRASPYKYLDIVFWTFAKLEAAQSLGLDRAERPLRILDIGAGATHFARVCRHFGHEVVSTDIDVPVYDEIAATLGETRVIQGVWPMEALPDLGGRFDMVTAMAINFHNFVPPTPERMYWGMEEWAFFLNDLIGAQLNLPGRIFIQLNKEYRGDEAYFNPQVLDLCRRHGAEVTPRGRIDWTLDERVTVRP